MPLDRDTLDALTRILKANNFLAGYWSEDAKMAALISDGRVINLQP